MTVAIATPVTLDRYELPGNLAALPALAASGQVTIRPHELIRTTDGRVYHWTTSALEIVSAPVHHGTVANVAALEGLHLLPSCTRGVHPGDTCFRTDTQQTMRCIALFGASLSDWEVVPTDVQKTAGVVVRPTITRNGDGTVTVGSDGIYAMYTDDTPSVIGQFSCTGGTFTLTEGATHYLLARYSGGSASLLWTTDRSQVEGDFRTVIPIETLYLFGGEIHGDSWDEAGHALAEKMLNRLVNTSRYVRDEIDGGLALGELTGRIVTISSGSVWRGVEKIPLAAFNSSTSGRLLLHVWNGTSWTVSQVTQYDNSNYQGASGLVALQNTNRYAVNWLFRTGGDDSDCVLILGTGDYTLDQALASGVPSNLPALATKHGFLVGRIIVAKDAASAYRIESAFTTGFQSGAVNDHGALSNLQGGTVGEYYHQSHAQWLRNQSPNTANSIVVTDGNAVFSQSLVDPASGWILNALNGKQPTISSGTTSQYYRGDKTFQDFATSVRAAILTGLNTSKLSSREVLSTDSLLSAIGLLQGQLTSIVEQNYYAQAGDTKLEIPLSYTGTGAGVLTLRLLSDIAQTATIDGAGKFYSDSAGTLNESTSFAMAANSWTTFYIKVPSGTCNVTIPNGYAIRAFGDVANTLVTETNSGPKINGLSTKSIRLDVLSIYASSTLGIGVISGQTYQWLNTTSVLFNGNLFTVSGVTHPWLNATQVYFSGNAMTVSGVAYPWLNATRVIFSGSLLTVTTNISTSALYSGNGNFDLYIDGTGMQVTYPTSRAWPVNISRIYLRPSVGSMPSAEVDRLFNDLNATPGLTAVGSKLLDLRGSCGAVTAASATARANLAAKGFTVSFNV